MVTHMGFIKFLGSQTGRLVRIALGVALVGIGLWLVRGAGGYTIAAVGLVPFAAGVFDFCLFAPLGGLPFGGRALRARVRGA